MVDYSKMSKANIIEAVEAKDETIKTNRSQINGMSNDIAHQRNVIKLLEEANRQYEKRWDDTLAIMQDALGNHVKTPQEVVGLLASKNNEIRNLRTDYKALEIECRKERESAAAAMSQAIDNARTVDTLRLGLESMRNQANKLAADKHSLIGQVEGLKARFKGMATFVYELHYAYTGIVLDRTPIAKVLAELKDFAPRVRAYDDHERIIQHLSEQLAKSEGDGDRMRRNIEDLNRERHEAEISHADTIESLYECEQKLEREVSNAGRIVKVNEELRTKLDAAISKRDELQRQLTKAELQLEQANATAGKHVPTDILTVMFSTQTQLGDLLRQANDERRQLILSLDEFIKANGMKNGSR